jgi:hypothetical protein
MSVVVKDPASDLAAATPAGAAAELDAPADAASLSTTPVQVCRVGFSAHNFSKDSIAHGLNVPVVTNVRNSLEGQAVVEKISLLSVHSDLDVPCEVSLNLFTNTDSSEAALRIDNKHGWPLFSCKKPGYVPLVAANPCEQLRCPKPVALYEPGASLTDRFISTYGNLTADKVRSSVVDLPNEPFSLVDTSSIVSRVIESNWDQLGLSASQMPTAFDGRYMRVSDAVVSHVCSELNEQVLGKIPFSRMDKLSAHLAVPAELVNSLDDAALYNVTCELQVTFREPPGLDAVSTET